MYVEKNVYVQQLTSDSFVSCLIKPPFLSSLLRYYIQSSCQQIVAMLFQCEKIQLIKNSIGLKNRITKQLQDG